MVTKVIDSSIIKDTCIQGIEATRKHDLTCLLACPTIVYPTYVEAREMILQLREKEALKAFPQGVETTCRMENSNLMFSL